MEFSPFPLGVDLLLANGKLLMPQLCRIQKLDTIGAMQMVYPTELAFR